MKRGQALFGKLKQDLIAFEVNDRPSKWSSFASTTAGLNCSSLINPDESLKFWSATHSEGDKLRMEILKLRKDFAA